MGDIFINFFTMEKKMPYTKRYSLTDFINVKRKEREKYHYYKISHLSKKIPKDCQLHYPPCHWFTSEGCTCIYRVVQYCASDFYVNLIKGLLNMKEFYCVHPISTKLYRVRAKNA